MSFHAGQKKTIEELSEQNESIQGSLVEKCIEVNRLKEEAAVLVKDKEELQSRVSHVNEILNTVRSALYDRSFDDKWKWLTEGMWLELNVDYWILLRRTYEMIDRRNVHLALD